MIAILCGPLVALFLARVIYLAVLARGNPGATARGKARRLWRTAGLVILAGGLAGAGYVDRTTAPQPEDDADIVDYDIVGGQAFPVKASQSISYQRRLEASGGNYDLLTDQILRWLAGRWRGRNLATTLAVLSAAGFVACFFFSRSP